MSLEETTSAPAPAAEAPASPPPAPEAAPKEAPDQNTEAPERDLDEDLAKVWKKANTLRSEDGKFATKDGRPPKNHNAPPEELQAEAQPEQPKAPEVPMPRSWAKEQAAIWEKADPEVKQYIAQREQDVHRYISQVGQQVKQFEPLRNVLEQNRQTFERNGTNYVEGISALIQAQNVLDQNPINGIANLAQIYGVDLRAVVQQMYGGQDMGLPPDPEVAQLKNELAQLRREQEYAKSQETARQRAIAEQQAEQQRMSFSQRIEQFAKDKPDFDEAAPEILANIQAIQQTSPGLSPDEVLQQAYDRAIWANPKTREAKLKAEETRRLQEAAKQAEQAKRASSINVRSAPKPSAPGEDLDADLRSIFRKAQSRS